MTTTQQPHDASEEADRRSTAPTSNEHSTSSNNGDNTAWEHRVGAEIDGAQRAHIAYVRYLQLHQVAHEYHVQQSTVTEGRWWVMSALNLIVCTHTSPAGAYACVQAPCARRCR